MCNLELIPLIEEYKQGIWKNFDSLYGVFERLIQYYSRRLDLDDSQQELTVFFIELLYRIPLDKFEKNDSVNIQKYLAASIRNKYIALSKAQQIHKEMTAELIDNIPSSSYSLENNAILVAGLGRLTPKQNKIIIYKYIYGYSDCEISAQLHISRQAVNRLKIRGLLVLKEFMENKKI